MIKIEQQDALDGTSSANSNKPTLIPNDTVMQDDDDDEIVREIPVYISSNKAKDVNLNLIQWPLIPMDVVNPIFFKNNVQNQRQNLAMVPDSARIRVKHEMLELDYSFNGNSQVYESNVIPAQTHLAIGRWSEDGEAIHLTPLSATYQVRPSFRYFDQRVLPSVDDGFLLDKREKQTMEAKPLMFKKKESEKAIAARKNSYAYKREREESEEWIELDVKGTSDENFILKQNSYLCSNEDSKTKLVLTNPRGNETGSSSSEAQSASSHYTKSLCYLPNNSVSNDSMNNVHGVEL